MAGARSLSLPQILHLLAQAAVAPHQATQIENVNRPGGDVGGIKKLDGIHCGPRVRGTLALDGEADPAGSSSDSRASASSTSRRSFSRRYRDQQTRNAKHRNAIQLISSTRNIPGSIEPPPPITG